ncbi:MAG: helix-turn-helix domain-containing protein [Solirubrobacteraceae bacterium]
MARQASDPELLEAARRAFAAHGYAGATIERIAAEAGASRVTLHRRGATKDGLLAELIARAIDDHRRAMWPALTGPGTGARLRRGDDPERVHRAAREAVA